MDTPTGEHGRPLGVTLISVVVMAFGVVTAVVGLLGMLVGFVSGLMQFPGNGAGREFVGGLVGLILGGAYLLAGYGLYLMRPWAWWLAVIAGLIGFVLAFGSPVWMVLWGGLVVYLALVRSNFGVLKGKQVLAHA